MVEAKPLCGAAPKRPVMAGLAATVAAFAASSETNVN
jgi:hypothetical protein